MSKKLIIGNWKMNGSISLLHDFSEILDKENFIIALPYPLIPFAKSINPNVKIAAQDCSIFRGKGAYTGEISADMLKEFGAEYVIVGHSERREFFNESGSIINKKVKNALLAELKIIYCVSENFENQIKNDLEGVDTNIIMAYEPISAIGTGITPSTDDVFAVTTRIKNLWDTKILYGGSVNSSNISDFLGIENVNGVLVGGASLKLDEVKSMLWD
ncbi:MAG: triose-phosphate isomerase [Holosporales bacterium]|jgi:triosephosphate isomerase|nr:triose-phosphate isomerase [Holosporales bacterium]